MSAEIEATVTVRLSERVLDTIRRHAAAAYPHECCGALIGAQVPGKPGSPGNNDELVEIADAKELDNVTEEGPRRRFRVSTVDYRQAEARARELGAELVGFYHSHPDHPALPSQYDLDHAWPNFSYVIVAVEAGTPGDVRSWRLRPDRSQFDEETIA